MKEFNFIFNKTNLKEIISNLKDLCKIDTMIKIKFDKEHVLFYSKAGTGNNILCFKSFIYDIEDFIIADEYINMDFIILNGVNFVKNLELFNDCKNDIKGKLAYRDGDRIASMFYISETKLKINFVTGDYKQIKDIPKTDIEQKMNPDYANFSFTITKEELNQIKKLSSQNKSETVSLRIINGVLEFFDTRWAIHVADLPLKDNEEWTFNNKYLKSINVTDNIEIHMFDQFLLFKENNIALMIGLELSEIK